MLIVTRTVNFEIFHSAIMGFKNIVSNNPKIYTDCITENEGSNY